MKSAASATATSAIPVGVGEPVVVQPHRIPMAAKLAGTAFLAVLLPVYWRTYGPTNFLWFCDAALILTVAGMWLENPLLISMCSVGILLPQCLWLADFGSSLLGIHLLGLTGYMLDPRLSLFTRALSLFHGWLPLLLVWLLGRLRYDKRALAAWTGLAAGLVFVCYFFTPPAGAHLANPNTPINLNNVWGFNDQQPQTWLNPNLYVILWFGALWLVAFLPTHLVLRRIFAAPPPMAGESPQPAHLSLFPPDLPQSSQHKTQFRSLNGDADSGPFPRLVGVVRARINQDNLLVLSVFDER
jgi:hypothetical protein